MAQQYLPGQRWISDSEAELGLGTILTQDGRMLTVLYPATGETRQYATRSAPLTRVRFVPGDEITHFEGWKMTVREVDDVDGLLVYHGLTAQNEARTLPETQLSNFIQFRLASDRLFAGQIDPLAWFSLRYHTLQHQSAQLQSSLWGLGGVRAQPIAHQLHIAKEVADRIAPRVLLADEVGLGKTIEAGSCAVRCRALHRERCQQPVRRHPTGAGVAGVAEGRRARPGCRLRRRLGPAGGGRGAPSGLAPGKCQRRIPAGRTAGGSDPRGAAADRDPGTAGPGQPLRPSAPARPESLSRPRRLPCRELQLPASGRSRAGTARRGSSLAAGSSDHP